MEIHEIPIDRLRPAEYNPRQANEAEYNAVKESLTKFQLVEPLIVNKHSGRENVVVGGHLRLKILRDLGHKTVPVVFVDLPIDQEQELNLRLNRNLGSWDWDKLASFDITLLKTVGFPEKELEIAFAPDFQPDDGTPAKLDEKKPVKCPECGNEFTP